MHLLAGVQVFAKDISSQISVPLVFVGFCLPGMEMSESGALLIEEVLAIKNHIDISLSIM